MQGPSEPHAASVTLQRRAVAAMDDCFTLLAAVGILLRKVG